MEGMKKITLYPAPHLEVKVYVSDEMIADYKDCRKKAEVFGGEGKDCKNCSWDKVILDGDNDVCACTMADWSKYF